MNRSTQVRKSVIAALLADRATGVAVIETAAEEAARTRGRLVVVPMPTTGLGRHERPTGTWLAQRVEEVHGQWPQLQVTVAPLLPSDEASTSSPMPPAAVLVATSNTFSPTFVCRVGNPLLIAAGSERRRLRSRVVVAVVQQRPSDDAVVRSAIDAARARRCTVNVLYAYVPDPGESAHSAALRAHAHMAQVLDAARSLSGLEILGTCVYGPTVQVLTQHRSDAELLVLDACAGMDASEVGHVLKDATCDVMVLRRPPEPLGAVAGRRSAFANV